MNVLMSENSRERAIKLLTDALENGWKTYRNQLRRCRDEFSNEAVHDLRVAIRRMMAVIQLLNSISPRRRFEKLIRKFKQQLDEFDELRDVQVILAEISETIRDLPQLSDFQKQQLDLEMNILKGLRGKITNFQTTDIARRIRKIHETWQRDTPPELESGILDAVEDAYQVTCRRVSMIDETRPRTIHRVRVAFKRFRYIIENVHPLLEGFPAEQLRRMNDYQTLMGEVQDAEVFLQTLSGYAESASSSDLQAVRHYYERRHAEAVAAYIEDMNCLHSFWRVAPDQPFPWEKNT